MLGSDNPLALYLTDHLAGSVLAVDLLTQMETNYAGTETGKALAALRDEIERDRQELKRFMHELRVGESRVRKSAAWMTAKFTEMKLRLEDRAQGPLRLLESVELVALGIDGKLALWRALEAAAEILPELRRLDFASLAQSALDQRRRAEDIRLAAAKTALTQVQRRAG